MKPVLTAVIILIAVFASPVHATETEWVTQDTVMQVVFTILLEVDRRQTHWIARNPATLADATTSGSGGGLRSTTTREYSTRHEYNPLIGESASSDKINLYFGAAAIGHAAVSYGLRKTGIKIFHMPAVNIWQGVWIGVESGVIARNISIGVKTTF